MANPASTFPVPGETGWTGIAPSQQGAQTGGQAKGEGPTWTQDQWAEWWAQQPPQQAPTPEQANATFQQFFMTQSTVMNEMYRNQQTMAQQLSQPTPQPQQQDHLGRKQLSTPILPDPREVSWTVFERAVAEFKVDVVKHASSYQIVRAVKDALPDTLQILVADLMSVDECRRRTRSTT